MKAKLDWKYLAEYLNCYFLAGFLEMYFMYLGHPVLWVLCIVPLVYKLCISLRHMTKFLCNFWVSTFFYGGESQECWLERKTTLKRHQGIEAKFLKVVQNDFNS